MCGVKDCGGVDKGSKHVKTGKAKMHKDQAVETAVKTIINQKCRNLVFVMHPIVSCIIAALH